MTARMRWGALVGTPVPWLAALAGVVLVASLGWLTTDDPAASWRDVPEGEAGALTPTTSAPARGYSGVDALRALLIEAPAGGPFEPIPEDGEDVGPRTEDIVVAEARAEGQPEADIREGIRLAGFLGGVTRGWVNQTEGSALIVGIDEFATVGGAEIWHEGVVLGLGGEPEVTEVPSPIDAGVGRRFDVETPDGVQHIVIHFIQRGRRVAMVKLATFGAIDLPLVEGYARAQADRMATAAP